MRGLSLIPAAGAPLKISHVRNQWGENLVVFCSKPISTGDLISTKRFLKQKYSSVPKLRNCCREIRMFQLALRTYFGIYISKWQGSVKHFQQKFKLARFFWSEGPKFRMKGLFPSCQVLRFGPTTFSTWISDASLGHQKSSQIPKCFFTPLLGVKKIPVDLCIFRPCFTRPDSYNDQLGVHQPHISVLCPVPCRPHVRQTPRRRHRRRLAGHNFCCKGLQLMRLKKMDRNLKMVPKNNHLDVPGSLELNA